MKTPKILIAIITSSLVSLAAAAPQAQWASALSNNKSSNLITTKINSHQVNTNREVVSFSYKLDADKALNFDVQPFKERSLQYWVDSTGNKLANGINLPVTGGETIIRISPLTTNRVIKLSATDILIKNNNRETTVQVFADSNDLNATGVPFSDNSIALKINANAGNLNLKVNSSTNDTPFVIHVLEKDSPYVLSLTSTKATYGANETISITTAMFLNNKNIGSSLQGYINRPDGSLLGELKFNKRFDGSYAADIDAIGAQSLSQGLWQVHVFAQSTNKGVEIMRDAQTSFAVKLNTAEFSSRLKMSENSIQVGVNVGLVGRYEVRAVLMGTNKAGQMQPIAMTMAADWLKTGQQGISLPIDAKLIAESKLTAPFMLKNIQLTNQTYLAPVQRITSGINLTGIDF